MHNDLAWAVLGVEPSISSSVETAAKQEGIAIGSFLELVMAAAHEARAEKVAAASRDQRLSDLICSMADKLMTAADIVKEVSKPSSERATSPEHVKWGPEPRFKIPVSKQEKAPQVLAARQELGAPLAAEQLSALKPAEESKGAVARKPTTMFARGLLRLSA